MKKQYRSFEDARKFARYLKLKTRSDWRNYCKSCNKPEDIPYDPDLKYSKNEWTNWNDFLGSKKTVNNKRNFLPFKKAREFVRTQNLKNFDDWRIWYKSTTRPKQIPANPKRTYKNEFLGYADWLGTDTIASQKKGKMFLVFKDAKKFVQTIPPRTQQEWEDYVKTQKIPNNIPKDPASFYRKNDTWKSWPDWFGTDKIANRYRVFWSYEKASTFAQSLKIQNQTEWFKFCKSGKLPNFIPTNPQTKYKHEWKGWGTFLGTGNLSPTEISKKTLSWREAKKLYQKIVKENKITNLKEWNEYVKTHQLPKGLPKSPKNIYTKKKVR